MHALEFITSNVIQLLRAMQGVQSEIKPLETFLKVGNVRELNLRRQGLTIQDIENLCRALKENKTLIVLDLGLNRIGIHGALCLQKLLEANTPLMSLNLERNPLCVNGAALLAEGLKKNTHLQILNLRQTQMCSAGSEHLAAALCINTTLKSLDLGLNGISKRTGAYFANAVKVNMSLISLNLEDNQLGDEDADALLEVVNFMITQSILRSFVVHLSQNGISVKKLFLLQSALAAHKAIIDNIKPIVEVHLTSTVASIVTEYLGLEPYSMNSQRGLKRLRA